GSLTTALANATNFTGHNSTTYKASGCSFYCVAVNTWTGATDTDWNTVGNWDGGVPTSSSTVMIPNVANKPIISTITAALANNITVSDILSIQAGGNLTVSSNLTNNGTFSINSDATSSGSLIVTGTSTGNITYNRYLTGVTKWHLFSAPVGNQDINSFVTTAGNIATSGVNYSLAPYDNTLIVGSTTWKKWTTDGTNPLSSAGSFTSGKGYEILTTSDGTVPFTGTVPVAQVTIAVTGTSNRWNLVGNPYPASIPANSNADANNNFLTVNSAALDPSFVAVYLWNPDTSSYDLINQASAATYIAPGQGFFIKAVTGEAGIVNFTTAMRTNQAAVAFQKTATPNIPSI
ncbi:MAG: hypothetical protein GW794_14355, partial [Flavobacteriales bacterium]|nr:hypothetical protein [Flavobacteriales bacterium]